MDAHVTEPAARNAPIGALAVWFLLLVVSTGIAIVSVDDMTFRSFTYPVTVSDYRAENDTFWTTGTRKIVEDTAERYPYGNLHDEHASYITPACAFHVIKHLEKTLESMHDSVVYAVGYTKKSNREIKHIEDRLPINLIINKSTATTLYYPLLFLIPSRMVRLFLIKINDKGCLVRLFHELNGHLAIRYSILDKKGNYILDSRAKPPIIAELVQVDT